MKLESWAAAPFVVLCLAAPIAAQQAADPKTPRTPDGHPTCRRVGLSHADAARAPARARTRVLTAEEAAAFERLQRSARTRTTGAPSHGRTSSAYNDFWWDYGTR
jgi:hypothetical protein